MILPSNTTKNTETKRLNQRHYHTPNRDSSSQLQILPEKKYHPYKCAVVDGYQNPPNTQIHAVFHPVFTPKIFLKKEPKHGKNNEMKETWDGNAVDDMPRGGPIPHPQLLRPHPQNHQQTATTTPIGREGRDWGSQLVLERRWGSKSEKFVVFFFRFVLLSSRLTRRMLVTRFMRSRTRGIFEPI